MSDDPVSLAEARAVKFEDSKLWSPADALRSLLRDIEGGTKSPKEIAIWYFEDQPDGDGHILSYVVSGLDREGHVYLLNHALRRVLSDSVV